MKSSFSLHGFLCPLYFIDKMHTNFEIRERNNKAAGSAQTNVSLFFLTDTSMAAAFPL